MPKYNKLVRDFIPKIIEEKGKRACTHIAGLEELKAALWAKLDEEINEFKSAKDPAELADVLEVVYALSAFYGVKPEELEKVRQEKYQQRGGFKLGIILEEVDE